MDDHTLMARLAAGDKAAAGARYDRYGRQVYSLALRMLGDTAAAEDVTQDVFQKVWQEAVQFDPPRGRPGTWSLHLAYTTAVDAVRARRRAAPGRYDARPELADLTADPAADAEVAVLGAQVRADLMRLPPEQRQALELAYFGAMTHQEIAHRPGPRLTLLANGLPPLTAGQAYHLWLIKDGRRTCGGAFLVDATGKGGLATWMPDDVEFDALGITLEPDARVDQPRGPKMMGSAI